MLGAFNIISQQRMQYALKKKKGKTHLNTATARLPEAPIGEVAGVTFWVLRPREWDGAGGRGCGEAPEGPGRGPGGVSLCGEVSGVLRGVVGWDVCPPANRASRLLRIYRSEKSFIHLQ